MRHQQLRIALFLFVLLVGLSGSQSYSGEGTPFIYHGVSTHSWSTLATPSGAQAAAIKSEVAAYEAAVGRTVAWVAFGHEWHTDGSAFPVAVATSIKNRGATPLIFLNLRTIDVGQTDPVYNLAAINAGQFDSKLEAWADAAKNFGSELIVDWGWEMNGDFTPWNGAHNGGTTEGPRRYREAYRRIIGLMRNRGANNIRWAFHINFPESPAESWNAFENYYPGDDVIDSIGASIYSAQLPTDEFFPSFESLWDPAYSRLIKMAPTKPVFVFEFGVTAGNPLGDSAAWANAALAGILSGRWPAVRGFAWWNDGWENDSNPSHNTEMRVEALPQLAAVFKSRLSKTSNLGDRPPISSKMEVDRDLRFLKTLAELRGIRIGGNYDYELRSETHDRIFEQEFNAMTAGTFWTDGSYKSRTESDFSEMDAKVSWGRARGMELHGHILVWYNDIPNWVKASSKADVEAIMNEHIDAVVGRYAGKIKVWDVVNEAVNDDDGTRDGALRLNHTWVEAMGNDYIRKAFVRAHAADPTAVLRYNEYDIESSKAKFDGVKALLINLKNQGAPVHALGWQLHVKPSSFDAATLLARMNEIADLGFDNYITELDVELPADASATVYEQQKQTYKTVVKTFLAARRHKTLVIWGLRDGSPYWLTNNHPLLFDENFNKKPAYFGVQEALKCPRFTAITRLADGKARLLLKGESSASYQVQVSNNLADWTMLRSIQITSADGTAEFLDDTAMNVPVRFYRLLSAR